MKTLATTMALAELRTLLRQMQFQCTRFDAAGDLWTLRTGGCREEVYIFNEPESARLCTWFGAESTIPFYQSPVLPIKEAMVYLWAEMALKRMIVPEAEEQIKVQAKVLYPSLTGLDMPAGDYLAMEHAFKNYQTAGQLPDTETVIENEGSTVTQIVTRIEVEEFGDSVPMIRTVAGLSEEQLRKNRARRP